MLSDKEKIRIVKDRIRVLYQQKEELRQEYKTNMKLIERTVSPEGYVTMHSLIPLDKHDEIKYKIRLCAIQARALQDELCRLYVNEEEP